MFSISSVSGCSAKSTAGSLGASEHLRERLSLAELEVGDVDKVLDGYLEPFLRGYLLAKRRGTEVATGAEDDLEV